MTARSGALAEALVLLQDAERTAKDEELERLALEAKLNHCSVLGAMGHLQRVLPTLRDVVAQLGVVAADSELLEDAQAELASFETAVAMNGRAQ